MFAILPVAVTNVFGLTLGPKVYVWILLGIILTSVINLIETEYFEKVLGFMALFYFGSACQLVCLVITCFYQEKLDVERLRKHNGLLSQAKAEQKLSSLKTGHDTVRY